MCFLALDLALALPYSPLLQDWDISESLFILVISSQQFTLILVIEEF